MEARAQALGVVRAVVGLHEARVEVAGVVRAGEGDAGLVHLGEVQHRPHGGEPASGVAERAHPVQVHPRPGPGQLPQRRDVVGQAARVGQVAVGGVVEGLAPPGCASPVHRHHHEAQRRDGFRVEAHPAGVEARVDPVDLRAGVEAVHHRVALPGVEPSRPVQHAVDVRHPVGRLDAEPFRRRPAGGGELADVGALQLDQHPPGPVADAWSPAGCRRWTRSR